MSSRAARKRKTRQRGNFGKYVMIVIGVMCSLIGIACLLAVPLLNSWLKDLPDYDDAAAYSMSQKTQVYANDRTTLLAEFYIENREPVGWDGISQYVKDGSIATEDERFYQHGAFDPVGIARAIFVRITGQGREGASTITQQFVRNTILLDEMHEITLRRKVREIYIASKLEERYSKDDILLMYLNTINYGSGAYGVETASQTYFSKHASDLTLPEAATLVAIPQSPTANNPIEHPDTCQARRDLVLNRMLVNGYIDQAAYDEALATNVVDYLHPNPSEASNGLYKYPYFTSYVRDLLLEKYDKDEVFRGGMTVYTTLDPRIQQAAEQAARNKEAKIPSQYEVALTAVDPETGYIKAMVGGKDFNTDQYNLATQARRQAGSSFKTFTLIAALEDGIDPNTIIDCTSPVEIGKWKVENYGGHDYGMRTLTGAFAISSNTAFARLIDYVTPDKVAEVAKRMGIETEIEKVPSITLGSMGVSTTEMAQAYATIADGGLARKAHAIEEIVSRNGRTIYKASTNGKRVLSPEVAHAATEVMKTVVTNGTGMAARLNNGQPVAGKTGTTENWRDSYFCGITPQLSVAIWLGARVEEQMPEYITATSVFSDFMNQVLKGQPIKQFPTAKNPKYNYDRHYPFSGYIEERESEGEDPSAEVDDIDEEDIPAGSVDTQTEEEEPSNAGTSAGGANPPS